MKKHANRKQSRAVPPHALKNMAVDPSSLRNRGPLPTGSQRIVAIKGDRVQLACGHEMHEWFFGGVGPDDLVGALTLCPVCGAGGKPPNG